MAADTGTGMYGSHYQEYYKSLKIQTIDLALKERASRKLRFNASSV